MAFDPMIAVAGSTHVMDGFLKPEKTTGRPEDMEIKVPTYVSRVTINNG
jgi:hypothetical protein